MPPRLYPRLLLAVLTGLNILNYIDRNVLFAVQSDVKKEFLVSDAKIGLLTSAFFFTYMFAAPVVGWMGDRFPRKNIVVFGIFQENIVNQVLEDVVGAVKPKWAVVKGVFRPRGGIGTTVEARWPRPKK